MGPKVGRLFPIQFSIPQVLSFVCSTIKSKTEVWHKHLGHPNSNILSHLSNSGLLGNKCHLSNVSIGKVKHFLFLLMVVELQSVLMLFTVMFGDSHLLLLMPITSIL